MGEIDRFLAKTGMKESSFGRGAVNDWKLIGDIRKGRRLWPDTEERIRTFMDSYEPKCPPTIAVCNLCSQHLTDITLRSCSDTGCPHVGSRDDEFFSQGGTADRGQGAGSSPLSTSQPGPLGAATKAPINSAGNSKPSRKAA